MSDFRKRLFEEHAQLRERIFKLTEFITGETFNTLPEIDRDDLQKQLIYMQQYWGVLDRRVSRLCGDA